MQGTIYLKKKNNEPENNEPVNSGSESVVEDSHEDDLHSENKEDIDDIEPIVTRKENSEPSSWNPGFLQPEEELEQEAAEIAEVLTPQIETEETSVEEGVSSESDVEVSSKENSDDEEFLHVDESLRNLSKPFLKYLFRFKSSVKEENKKASNPIYVDEIASKFAKLYETVRRIVDWKEEHLIRRSAIERMLKRRFVSKVYGISIIPDVNPADAAEPLILELIRSGYFPNGKIAKQKIDEIQVALEKYLYVLNNAAVGNGHNGDRSKKDIKAGVKKKINLYNWIIEIAACEIEDILDAPLREYALLDLMTESLLERIKVLPENILVEKEEYVQTYITVHRTLFNLDNPIISFHLLKYKYPEFFSSKEFVPEFTDKIIDVWGEIEADLGYEKSSEFFKVADKYDAAYLMIGDAMNLSENDLDNIDYKVSDPGMFLSLVEKSYNSRLATLKKRLSKLAVFSTLSILVAGAASLLIFEIPVATLVIGDWSLWAIVADLAIPTFLMFFLVRMIKPPSGNNLEAIKEEVTKIAYKVEELDIYEVLIRRKVRKVSNFIFALVYLAGGAVSLYGIYWVFELAKVPWTSLYINTANVAMVVASAMIIRQRSKELTIVEKENVIEFLLDFFSIPLAKIGAWFSRKWKEYNIVSVFFIALVDFPFSAFVAMLEGWRSFIKQKRSELN
ncbi:hypothetical protein K0B04_02830 [Patescibacteria group bacterium]|nr:hypothetical protein [Patescibacteria group bacterium]